MIAVSAEMSIGLADALLLNSDLSASGFRSSRWMVSSWLKRDVMDKSSDAPDVESTRLAPMMLFFTFFSEDAMPPHLDPSPLDFDVSGILSD